MLLALDVGNSNVTIGVFEGSQVRERWRLRTIYQQTADEWGILMRNLFSLNSDSFLLVRGDDDRREHIILAGGVHSCF